MDERIDALLEVNAGQQWINRTHDTVLAVVAVDPSAPSVVGPVLPKLSRGAR